MELQKVQLRSQKVSFFFELAGHESQLIYSYLLFFSYLLCGDFFLLGALLVNVQHICFLSQISPNGLFS